MGSLAVHCTAATLWFLLVGFPSVHTLPPAMHTLPSATRCLHLFAFSAPAHLLPMHIPLPFSSTPYFYCTSAHIPHCTHTCCHTYWLGFTTHFTLHTFHLFCYSYRSLFHTVPHTLLAYLGWLFRLHLPHTPLQLPRFHYVQPATFPHHTTTPFDDIPLCMMVY